MCCPGYTAAVMIYDLKEKTWFSAWASEKQNQRCSLYYRSLTVDDGDVSVLVVLWQRDRGTRDGRQSSDRPAAISAVKVARCHPCLVPSTCSSGPTRQSASSQATTQAVGDAERIPRAVAAVWLVDPLHHGGLGGHAVVLTWQDHWLEQHSIPFLISHKHMNPRATVWEDICGRIRR